MITSNSAVSEGLDRRFASEKGLYGTIEDIPLIAQKGHYRRMALLDGLPVGDVTDKICVDFGTGSWGFAGIFPRLHHCKLAYGLDISKTAIEQSAALSRNGNYPYGDRFEYRQSDGLALPLPDESVDVIFAGEAIEHVRLPQRFLSECYRALTEHGQIIITTPNRDAILYKTQGDQYCVGPEHFWLFNAPELESAVSEFFKVENHLGFNGSIYRDLDRKCADPVATDAWAKQFQDAPHMATGLILRATKRSVLPKNRYNLTVLDRSRASVVGQHQVLSLEFGLTGWMIDSPSSSIRFDCPPCVGLVIFMWTHAWSGFATIRCGGQEREVSLWSHDPGWKPVHFVLNSAAATSIEIGATGKKEERAQNAQVIFFEALHYNN